MQCVETMLFLSVTVTLVVCDLLNCFICLAHQMVLIMSEFLLSDEDLVKLLIVFPTKSQMGSLLLLRIGCFFIWKN